MEGLSFSSTLNLIRFSSVNCFVNVCFAALEIKIQNYQMTTWFHF